MGGGGYGPSPLFTFLKTFNVKTMSKNWKRMHSSTNGVLKIRYKKINIVVYILGRIPPISFVSSAK